jgi:cytochrome c-type biogenesis protein CcmH
MVLWISFAVLTAAVVAFLLRPLRGGGEASVGAASADLAVYRDQLQEIDAERERGLLTADEFEGARTEIARRLIKRAEDGDAAGDAASSHPVQSSGAVRGLTYVIGGLVPVLAVVFYLSAGSPNLGSQPFLARQAGPIEQAPIVQVIARIEERLRAVPDDGQGWDVIAPVYLRLGRYGDAAHAYAEAARLLGETPKRLVGFGEATLMINNGVVTDAVRGASERILQLEPGRIEARIWLILAMEQDGNLAGAVKAYRELLDTGPKDASWRQAVTERVDLIEKKIAANDKTPLPSPAAGPAEVAAPQRSQPDAAGVQSMSPEDREKFIARMVDGLAERLKTDGRDLDGWIRLLRAYKVLGRESDAVAALGSARRNFADDQKSLAQLDEAAKGLGIGS